MSEKISVLIPTFNREKFIASSLKTILRQTYTNLDIIIYDDGSTDNTVEIIKAMKDPRIRVIEGKVNKGVGYARNKLLDACQTKYALWHDSDDVSNIYRVQYQYDDMIRHGDKLIGAHWTKLRIIRDKQDWKKEPRLTTWAVPAFATFMFPVNKKIRFKEELKIGGEDWDWVKRMREKYGHEIVLAYRLYYVRWHDDRIGVWKRKFRKSIPLDKLKTLSYKELISYYHKHHA